MQLYNLVMLLIMLNILRVVFVSLYTKDTSEIRSKLLKTNMIYICYVTNHVQYYKR